jgi:transposase
MEVADFIIDESIQQGRPLDVRMVVNGFADRLQAEDGDAGCTWRDLVASTLRGHPAVVDDVEPAGIRAQTKARELAIARELGELDPKERLHAWRAKTGKSQAALYRRLMELGRVDALDQ